MCNQLDQRLALFFSDEYVTSLKNCILEPPRLIKQWDSRYLTERQLVFKEWKRYDVKLILNTR